MPSRNLVNVKSISYRFYILNCNDDSFDDHTMNYGPIGSNHFNHHAVSCHGIADDATRLEADVILWRIFLADCGINFKGFNFYTTCASHRQIKSVQSTAMYIKLAADQQRI